MHPKTLAASGALSRPVPVPPGDEIVTATSDTGGYHLFAAAAGDGWRWHALATLQPGGYSEEAWIGEHCTTGDGRYVVAVVAPWSANNTAAGIAAGGIAYAIDAHTGAVRPLASGLLLSYFNPGCGTGSTVALSRYTSADQSSTQVLAVDAATGRVSAAPVIANQVTSSVPVAGTLYAAEGHRLVRIGADGAVSTVAAHQGPVFDLTPNAAGAVDYLAQDGSQGKNPATAVFRLAAGKESRAATGTTQSLRLLAGLDGHDTVLGATSAPAAALGMRTASRAASVDAFADASSQGTMAVGPGPRTGSVNLVGIGSSATGGGKLPAPAAAVESLAPMVTAADQSAGTANAAKSGAVHPSAAVPPDGGGDVGATCAVPRNDPNYQVPQPSDQQIDWALNLAGQYGLPVRSNSYANLNTGQYDPSADFPLPAPFDGTTGIPRQIMEGIFAQESNWKQASPHAPAGLSGNPLIADYYGIYSKQNTTGNVDFPLADCGYGLGQITDLMRLANVGNAPTALQKRVALDYTENSAATAQTLARKWDQLAAAGITVGDDNPMEIENWYFAIWAYNSGVNPQAVTGNTTGCTPGPSCADSAGNWGLGWTNNPASANYNPLRPYFLRLSYADASHPQDWPYQEKVFGWIESGQYESDGVTPKYTPTGYFLDQPGFYDFCDSSDNCNELNLVQPCGYNASTDPLQWHCWWHKSTGICLLNACHLGDWDYDVTQAEPSVANPFPSVCAPPANFTDTYIVDDSVGETNLAGCTGMAAANAAMTWTPNTDPGGGQFGNVDLHQIGTGYGGRTMFTHLEDTGNAVWGGTMTWAPNNLDYDVYDIEVFVPTLGAAGTLTYTVLNQGLPIATVPVNQNNYGNQWVSIGTYYLAPGASVSTTNVVAGGDGSTDVAFDAIAFRPLSSYVSLGDSYSSGEGAGTYDEAMAHSDAYHGPGDDGHSTNQPGVNMCHRSADSYPRVWAQKYGDASIPVVQLACSGAVIGDLTTAGQYGEPAQIPATPKHAIRVFLTIGGNDAGFASVLANCLQYGGCESYYTKNDANNLDVKIDNLGAPLTAAYRQLNSRVPNSAVTLLTYPNIFTPTTTGTSCLFSTGLGLSAQDVEWLISEANHLDNAVERAVNPLLTAADHFTVQDERYAFAGHTVCASSPDVNGLQLNAAVPPTPKPESFHPNPSGYVVEATDLGSTGGTPGTWSQYTTLRTPLPGTPGPATAKALLGLVNKGTYNSSGWSTHARAWFNATTPGGTSTSYTWGTWPTVLGGCSTPLLVGIRDNDNAAYTPPALCTTNTYADLVGATATAFWYTPYDNPQATVTPNNPSNQLLPQVDHVVALKDAWSNGAGAWTQGLRFDFANDWRGIQLVTTSATTNGSKADKSIEEWQPPNTAYLCAYTEMWIAIKYEWNLRVDNTTVYTGSGPGSGMTEYGYLNAVLTNTGTGRCT